MSDRPPLTVEAVPCLRIDAPEWFAREDFADFVRGDRPAQGGAPPATWHDPDDDEMTEMSDVFVLFDHGVGSDADAIPDDIWEQIVRICTDQGVAYGVLWISPGD
jgi:hypothetical protein